MHHYYVIFKPFGFLSQFTKEGNHQTLADLGFKFPSDVYPVGRLDADSEGLLLLTDDKNVNQKLLTPSKQHWRTYLVQVENVVTEKALGELRAGMELRIDGKPYRTQPARVEIIPEPENLPERNPPVRFRKSVPTSWISLSLTEGKNRQVRKMTAQAGFPTLRLIRESIEDLRLSRMENALVEELTRQEVYSKLKLTGR
jgi:23S rRNA pseudouridine2457 synthase